MSEFAFEAVYVKDKKQVEVYHSEDSQVFNETVPEREILEAAGVDPAVWKLNSGRSIALDGDGWDFVEVLDLVRRKKLDYQRPWWVIRGSIPRWRSASPRGYGGPHV